MLENGEIFIDFIPIQNTRGSGYIYYMTDEYFYDCD